MERREHPVQPARIPTPGGWVPPAAVRPAWDWAPPPGIQARADRMPRWVRVWFHLPFVDRYAYSWMWHHGGWDVVPPDEPDAGVREPGATKPQLPVGRIALKQDTH